MTRTIKLVLAYDGTGFSGWQRQSSERSVQGAVEAALENMHGHPVTCTGSGRTDSGVHARGQVAHFETDIRSIKAERFVIALNSFLEPDVRVMDASEAPPGFHARFDARSRTYRYFIAPSPILAPELKPYRWRINRRPDLAALNRMASCLLGEHDFTAFANPGDKSLSRNRYVHRAHFFPEGTDIAFEITANAFLWKMVRSLTGSLVQYESEGRDPGYVAEVLESRDRRLAGATAPAHGLFFWRVDYYEPRPGNGGQ
jgi:tRNA pseudouridine38-40 synthase